MNKKIIKATKDVVLKQDIKTKNSVKFTDFDSMDDFDVFAKENPEFLVDLYKQLEDATEQLEKDGLL